MSLSVLVSGTGSALPARVLHNDDFSPTLATSDEWVRTRTGIRERRFAAPHESAASLGTTAARQALAAAGLEPADLDLIVCGSVTPASMCPSTACTIQANLGCRPVAAFDVLAACSGFLYALAVGQQFIAGGTVRHALILGTEVLSRVLDFNDRTSCILFGDGAGAAILSGDDEPGRGIHWARVHADGTGGDLIRVPGVTAHTPFCPPADPGPAFVTLHGREVFRFAVKRMTQLLEDALAECRALGKEIDLVVPHQVNKRIIDVALAQTGLPAERVVTNLDRYGNTASASVPIALDEAIRSGRAGPGSTVLLLAFGGGLTWGSSLITL